MTHDSRNVHDNIAYLRTLAHEGRHAPLLAGPVLVAAAVVFGIANLAQWAIQVGVIELDARAQLYLWIGAGLIFAAAVFMLVGRMKGRPGFSSTGNRAVGTAWSAVGYGIFATWLGLMALALKSGDWSSMMIMPTVAAVAYGSAWIISGAMTRKRWMTNTGVLAYAGAVVMGWFVGEAAGYLVFTGLLIAIALVPGLILMRQEPSEAA